MVFKSCPGCHGYHCCCVLCKVLAEVEETAEYQTWLPWLRCVFPLKYTLSKKKKLGINQMAVF